MNMHIAALLPLMVLIFWYPVSFVHEIGHWISAKWFGDCTPILVWRYGLFSETLRDGSQTPLLDVWMGPLTGVVIPGFLFLILRKTVAAQFLGWFASIALIGNGLYVGLGWLDVAGDPIDMIALGSPKWVLILFGCMCIIIVMAYNYKKFMLTSQ